MIVRKAMTMEMYFTARFENMYANSALQMRTCESICGIRTSFVDLYYAVSIILRQNEKLIKAVRRHKMFLMPIFFTWPLIVVGLLIVRHGIDFTFFGYWRWVLILSVLLVLLVILYKWFIWRNNALIITNQRVVENEQRGFFSKTVTELLYRDIREISYSKDGMNASIYDYGDLKMRTAADNDIIIEKIANPDETVELINQIRQGGKLSESDGDRVEDSVQSEKAGHV